MTTNEKLANMIVTESNDGSVIKKHSVIKVKDLGLAKDIIVSLGEKGYYCDIKTGWFGYKINVYTKINRDDITRLTVADDYTRDLLGIPYEAVNADDYTDDE